MAINPSSLDFIGGSRLDLTKPMFYSVETL
jgi:hypothetical protein